MVGTRGQPRGCGTPVSVQTGLHGASGEAVKDSNQGVNDVQMLQSKRGKGNKDVLIVGESKEGSNPSRGESQQGSNPSRVTKNGAHHFLEGYGMSATAKKHEADLVLILNTLRTGAKAANGIVESIYAAHKDTDVRAFCAPSLAGGTFVSAAAGTGAKQPELRQRWVVSFLSWCAKRDASSQSNAPAAPVQFGDGVAESGEIVKPVSMRPTGAVQIALSQPEKDESAKGKPAEGEPAKDESAKGKPAEGEPAEGDEDEGDEDEGDEDEGDEDEGDEDKGKTKEGKHQTSRNSHLTPEERRLRAQKKKEHESNSAMHRVRFPFDQQVSSSSKELSVFSLELNDKRKMSIVTYAILYVLLRMGGGYLMLSDRNNEKGLYTPCLKTVMVQTNTSDTSDKEEVKNDQDQESQQPKSEPDDKEEVEGTYHMNLVLKNNVDYVVMYQSFYRVHNDKVAKEAIRTVLTDHCKERLQLFDKSHLICHVCTAVNSKVVKKVQVAEKVFKRLSNNFCCSQHSGTVIFPVKFKDEEGNPKVFDLHFCSHYIHLLCSEVDSRVNRHKSTDSKKQPRFVQTYHLDTAKVDKIQELLNEVLLDSEGKPKYSPIDFLYFSDPNDTSMLLGEDMDVIPPKMKLENCEVRVPVFSKDDDENLLITNLLRTNFWNMSNSLLKSRAPNNRGGLNKHFLGDAYKCKTEPKAKRAKKQDSAKSDSTQSEDVQISDIQKVLETLKKQPEMYQRFMSELSAANIDTNIASGSADLTSATVSGSSVPASSVPASSKHGGGRKKVRPVISAQLSKEIEKRKAEEPAEEEAEEQAEEQAKKQAKKQDERSTKKRKNPKSSEQCNTEKRAKGRNSDTESDDDAPIGKSSGKHVGKSSDKPVGKPSVAEEDQVQELFGNMFKNKK